MSAREPRRPRPAYQPFTLDERRVERERRVSEAAAHSARSSAQTRLRSTQLDLLGVARQYPDCLEEQERLEEALAELQTANAGLEQGGLLGSVNAVLISPVKWLAIFTIDLCLLAGVSHFLISLVYATPDGPPWWAIVVVPGALFGLELAVAAHIATADAGTRSGGRSARHATRQWRLFGAVLAVVVPALGTAALITALRASDVQLDGLTGLLVVGVVALAAVCHSSVIFGGEPAMEAVARLAYIWQRSQLRRRIRRAAKASQRARDRAHDANDIYRAELDAYRASYGDPPSHLLMSSHHADLVKWALDEPVVEAPVAATEAPVDDATTPGIGPPAGAGPRTPNGPVSGHADVEVTPPAAREPRSATNPE
jgi:hypothetical protein